MSDDLEKLPQDGTNDPTSEQPTPSGTAVDANELAKYKAETERARKEAIQSRQKARESQAELESIKAQLDKVATIEATVSELQKQLQDEASARKHAELQTLKMRVVSEAGLPAELASFLQGDTPETIQASAESLAKAMPKGAIKVPSVGNGAPPVPVSRADDILARINGTSNKAFDIETHRSKGGNTRE